MSKPEDIPQDVWSVARGCIEVREFNVEMPPNSIARIARAIQAAKLEAYQEAAKVADAYAEVNWQAVTDSILLDPVLSNKGQKHLTKADWEKADNMAVDGTIHSSMYHAANNIASAIRNLGSEP